MRDDLVKHDLVRVLLKLAALQDGGRYRDLLGDRDQRDHAVSVPVDAQWRRHCRRYLVGLQHNGAAFSVRVTGGGAANSAYFAP